MSQQDLHQRQQHQHSTIVAPRRSGLSAAFSTNDIASSTQIDVRQAGVSRLRVRRQPVQRAASRLYRVNSVKGRGDDVCVGPEFIVRATHPSKRLDIANVTVRLY